MTARRTYLFFVFFALTLFFPHQEAADETPAGKNKTPYVKSPVNRWKRILREKTGHRLRPIFFYSASLKIFVLSGGMFQRARHFDTEYFDLASQTWTNAYPEGAPYKKLNGPTDAPQYKAKSGKQPFLTKDKNDVTRIRFDYTIKPWANESLTYGQWAHNTTTGRLYVHLFSTTASYDPVKREWKNLKANRFKKGKKYHLAWACMAYDSVNNEIVSIGGQSDEEACTPGTWTFSIETGCWSRMEKTDTPLQKLNAEAGRIHRDLADFANRCRNRYYRTENEQEAATDLKEQGQKVLADLTALSHEISAAELPDDKPAAEQACVRINRSADILKSVLGTIDTSLISDQLIALQKAVDSADTAEMALDMEPCGRANAQFSADPVNGRLLLFGGNRLDIRLADTWIYDCTSTSRKWRQKFPALSPSPRSKQTMAFLPQSKQFVLAGGNPFELWTYDPDANLWKLLLHAPKHRRMRRIRGDISAKEKAPRKGIGAVNSDDVMVWTGTEPVKGRTPPPRTTWICKIDPKGPDAGTDKYGVNPGTIRPTSGWLSPEAYDRTIKPEPEKITKLLGSLSPNVWHKMPEPSKRTAKRDYGTTPYDTERHQILLWGGGHSSHKWTDLAHYSLRTSQWSIGYRGEQPLNGCFYIDAMRTFLNRSTIPCHVWDGAAYDPPSQKALYIKQYTWVYDPSRREWDPPVQTPFRAYPLRLALEATAHGTVCLCSGKLYLYSDAERTWTEIADKMPGAYGDHTGLCYDGKRDCLWWMHSRSNRIVRFDMKTHKKSSLTPSVRGSFAREVSYASSIDLLVSEFRRPAENGTVCNEAFDPEAGTWVLLEFAYADGTSCSSTVKRWNPYSGSRSMHYDPEYNLLVYLGGDPHNTWVLHPSPKGLKRHPMPLPSSK